jgi:Fe-S oxidoreductase
MEFTAQKIKEGKLQFDKSKNPQPVSYHDPCNFGRSCNITEESRVILKASCQDFREMYPNRGENWCCGGGGGLSAMDDIIDFRMNGIDLEGLAALFPSGYLRGAIRIAGLPFPC